nr:GH92 family glycosyl hydrolase [Lentzea terrae]
MRTLVVTGLLLGLTVPAQAALAHTAQAEDPSSLVNPFVGTQNFGNTFPGASVPFGMVQVSPDTGGQGGYDYKATSIYGFSQTHLSGVGCGVMGELPVMPTVGSVDNVDINAYKSAFSHSDEAAQPGYYRVGLSRYGVNAELSSTQRTGWQRYTFPSSAAANVLFNTGRSNQTVLDSEIHVVGDRTIEGRVRNGRFCAGKDEHTVYFTATFDRPFASFGSWRGSVPTPGSRDAAGAGGNGAWVTFDASADRDVVLKIGLSYTGLEGARRNLAAEAPTFDFDGVVAAAREVWRKQLDAVRVSGGSRDRQVAFYTALYHSVLHPNLAGDVDGKYMGFDGRVRTASGYTPYQNFSLWDTYRPQNQLLQILEPRVARDVALSVVASGRDGGWLPRWALASSETNIMTGDPVTPFLVEAWSKGLLRGYEEETYKLLRANALSLPPASSPYNGRSGVEYYSDRGYIPSGLKKGTDCAHKGGDNDCDHPASASLEYSAADASLALMARGLGHRSDARLFADRGQWYRNLWDASTGHFRPRTVAGTWLTPYNPVDASHQFHEGGAYQYQWLVPQDPAGLVSLMGGRRAAEQRLDSFFAYEKLLVDPAGTARHDWITEPYDYYGKPTYNPNNEPDLLAPYMYLWTGTPWKTATVVRAAMTLFTTGPDGMTGNDDLGTMSAWYVFSSLGIYPTFNGADFLALSSPQFPSASVRIGQYGAQGGTLVVSAPGVSDSARYVSSASLNGRDVRKTWLDWSSLQRGGKLSYAVSSKPSSWGTGRSDEPPSLNDGNVDSRRALSASLRNTSLVMPTSDVAQSATLQLDVLAQSPSAVSVRPEVSAPAGWTVSGARPFVIVSRHQPVQKTVPLTVSVPAGVGVGSYEVSVVVGSVSMKAVIEVKPAAVCAFSSCSVDVGPERNHDGTATVDASAAGNFDGGGWSYDAALLPSAGPVTWGGITYQAPDPAGTAANFVEARGQGLLLPSGQFSWLHVVSASHNGPVSAAFTVWYTDGTSAEVSASVPDWAGGGAAVLEMPHRIKAGQGVDGPPVRLFGQSLRLDSLKTVRSVTLPNDPRVELYALTLA